MKAYTLKIRGGCEVDTNGRKAGKGALIQTELSATLGVSQDQYLFQPIAVLGGGREHSTICMDGTTPTLCTFQDSKPILVAKVNRNE